MPQTVQSYQDHTVVRKAHDLVRLKENFGAACVIRIISAILPVEIRALSRGRVLWDCRLSIPASANHSCQPQAVVFNLPEGVVMAWVPSPSEVRRMIRARQTCFWAASRSEIVLQAYASSKPKQPWKSRAHDSDPHR